MNKKGFRYFCFIVLCVAVFPLVFVFAPTNKISAESFDVSTQVQENVITSITGDFANAKVENQDDAFLVLDALKDQFGFSSSKEAFVFNKINKSIVGNVYKFKQIVNNIEVYGGEINISTLKSNIVSDISGKYFLDVNYNHTVNYTKEQAYSVVKNSYNEIAEIQYENTYIYDFEQMGYIAYVYNVSTIGEAYTVFVSAISGEITNEISVETSLRDSLPSTYQTISQKTYTIESKDYTVDITKYISQTGSFYALSNPKKKIYMTDGQNKDDYSYQYFDDVTLTGSFADDDAIKAYYSLLKCYDFYADSDSFGIAQEGIKNKNGVVIDLVAIVHFDKKYENAGYLAPGYSTTGYFIFGDGDNSRGTLSFVNGLDIVGHEYQHAYTEQICDFAYSGESGALSEAFSDMFGAVIEGKDIASKNFWIMGEDVVTSEYKIFRDMSNPSSTYCAGDYDTFMQNIYSCGGVYSQENDNGKIHTNCTLPTYATYLMYKNNPDFFTEYRILQLWYQTLTKLTKTSGILDFCAGMVASVDEFYKAGLSEYSPEIRRQIEYVFASLNIPGYTGVETWNDNSLTVLQGQGTISSPYLINSVADLASLAYYVNNAEGNYATARYKLTTDIEINAKVDWISIGTAENQFNGSFNGNSHKIIYNCKVSNSSFCGIFGSAGAGAFIYDLYIQGKSVQTTSEYAGAIVMELAGSLSGCSSSLDITGINVGGLVGLLKNSDSDQKIINCFATATLVGEEVGGLVCHFNTQKNATFKTYESGTIFGSYFAGDITASVAGGIVAKANSVYLINNMVNAKITANDSSSNIGGLVGHLQLNEIVDNKTASGARNYLLNNKVAVEFLSVGKTDKNGMLAGTIDGALGEGFIYIENNIVKESDLKLYNSSVAVAVLYDCGTSISTDEVYQDNGDFDFDNSTYYSSSNWFVIQGSIAFDLTTTFKIKSNSMPQFKELEFWLDSAVYNFAGSGTESDPYQISSASQLAGLAGLVSSETYYGLYASKHYILTKDIDLSGKVWAGIGVIKYTYLNNIYNSGTILGFSGTLNGNGHTISGMNTIGLYSISKTTADGSSYYLYEYNPGLFGVTTTKEKATSLFSTTATVEQVPTIKNLTIEDAVSCGTNAGSVVSRAFTEIKLDNVTAMNVNISSSSVAGGLIGKIEGKGGTYSGGLESHIDNCYVLGSISGVVVGGAVGEMADASEKTPSTISVVNFLLRGTINLLGADHSAEYDYDTESATYYLPLAGSIVGVTTANQVDVINCISFVDMFSYIQGASMGAFVGGFGVGHIYAKSAMGLSVDGSKFVGKMQDVFNKNITYAGSVVGIIHEQLSSAITIDVSSTTYTTVNNGVVYRNNNASRTTIQSEIQYSNDEIGTGAYNFYNSQYYSNPDYFNISRRWTEDQTARLYFTVIFYNQNEVYGQVYVVKAGETISAPQDPVRQSTAQYDYEFIGWDTDFTTIDRNMKINAKYKANLRSYEVSFVDEQGEIVQTKNLAYGSSVNQNIDAPEKKGNLFYTYQFVRWGDINQTVTGEMQVSPVYQLKLSKLSIGLITIAVFVAFVLIVVFVNKKSKA